MPTSDSAIPRKSLGKALQSQRFVSPFRLRFVLSLVLCVGGASAFAQANLPLYTDHLVNGFQDWGWGGRNLSDGSNKHSGSSSISLNGTAWNVALSLHQNGFNTSPYSALNFWANGGAGGQIVKIFARVNGSDTAGFNLSAFPTNSWKQYTISLASLGAANKTNVELFTMQLTSFGTTTPFYLDDIQLVAAPAPALVHLNINATQSVRTGDSRWFGCNTAIWDDNFDTPTTISFFKEMGTTVLRFPGGSLSDTYRWRSNYVTGSAWQGWPTRFTNFAHVATNIGAQAFITVNYGSGTAAEAADWVRYSNRTNAFHFKYWEIGNENYGSWEMDLNTNAPYHPNDPWTYAQRAADYAQQMRSADNGIRIGVVLAPGENNFSNVFSLDHPAVNPRTGLTNYGWTPIVLSTMKSLGMTPDFAVHHRYPQYTGSGSVATADSDALVLQSVDGWAAEVTDLRQMITDYFGPDGTNIELVCTENNSDAGAQGRQSTSLVNGLYYAESLAQLMKTELNAFVWWDFRNGTDTNGSFDSTLYGWRNNGDLGMIGNLSTRYPSYYAAKLMQYFAGGGDTILEAGSDYLLLQAYAARRANGSLSVLVVNRDPLTNFNGQILLDGYLPSATALLRTYGIPQDEAARTNAAFQSQDLATNYFAGAAATFNYNFPPLSLSLFRLDPAPPALTLLADPAAASFILQLQGQANVPYVLQTSGDLQHWESIATNTLASNIWSVTNAPVPDAPSQFYRALWQP